MEGILDSGGKWRKGLFCCLLHASASSGVSAVKKSDMVIVFFVTVKHFGKKPRRVMVTCMECCEKITEGDNDCDLIDLFGGDFGTIHPGQVMNLTLLYPNWYGFNRKGYCLVKVLHRNLEDLDVNEVIHRIEFDTTLVPDVFPLSLRGFWGMRKVTTCETPDLDPFNDCNPVNCIMKYSGNRNYYNTRIKMCERVPVCPSDPNKDLPDVAYFPNINKCINLDEGVTKNDIQKITEGHLNGDQDQMVNIRCHHGDIDPKTGLCICHYGWRSEPFVSDSKSTPFYSMCTIKCMPANPYQYVPLWMGLVLAIWFVFFVTLCLWYNSFTTDTESKASRQIYGTIKEDFESSGSKSTAEDSSSSNAVLETPADFRECP